MEPATQVKNAHPKVEFKTDHAQVDLESAASVSVVSKRIEAFFSLFSLLFYASYNWMWNDGPRQLLISGPICCHDWPHSSMHLQRLQSQQQHL